MRQRRSALACPGAITDMSIAIDRIAGYTNQKAKCEIGDSTVEHLRRVADQYITCCGRRHVHVVVSNSKVGHNTQSGEGIENGFIEFGAHGANDAVDGSSLLLVKGFDQTTARRHIDYFAAGSDLFTQISGHGSGADDTGLRHGRSPEKNRTWLIAQFLQYLLQKWDAR